jgi:hypothetical protein
MINIICSGKFEPLLLARGARVINGKWVVPYLFEEDRLLLEQNGAIIEGLKYQCWDTWFASLYQVTCDPRCTVSFNTLAKRAAGLTVLDDVIIGRAKVKTLARRKGSGTYAICYKDKTYPSETALARELGINLKKYRSRRQLGWSIEESVTDCF